MALVSAALAAPGCSSCDRTPKAGPVGQTIATLASLSGEVSHRPARSLTWSAAKVRMALRHRDALRTGRGSAAEVRFVKGGKLKIAALSLVVIEAPSDPKSQAPLVAKLKRGTLRGVARPGAPLRIVGADGKQVEIKADGNKPVPFRARTSGTGGIEVAVLGGKAKVRVGDQTTALTKNQAVEVKAGKVSRPIKLPAYPSLEAPAVDAKVSLGQPVQLTWSAVDGAARYHVQISTSTSFDPIVYARRPAKPSLDVPSRKLQPHTLYVWRVAGINATGHEGEFGFARRFSTLAAHAGDGGVADSARDDGGLPSRLLFPPDNATVRFIGRPKAVSFRWAGKKRGHYLLVVARKPDLKTGVVGKAKIVGHQTVMRHLRFGHYYWGVYRIVRARRRHGEPRLEPIFAQPQRLKIARRRPPAVAVPKTIKWNK